MHLVLPKLDIIHHISEDDFKTINWLPVNQKVHQGLNFTIFKYVNNVCCYYAREAFERRISSRNNRCSHQRCSVKKCVLRNFAKFTGKHLSQNLFLNKVAGPVSVFSCEFCEIFKNTFFTEHSCETASDAI